MQERYRALLRRGRAEETIPAGANPGFSISRRGRRRPEATGEGLDRDRQGGLLDLSLDSLSVEKAGELGRQLGRLSYHYYSELLAQGLETEEALELTKALLGRLVLMGCGSPAAWAIDSGDDIKLQRAPGG